VILLAVSQALYACARADLTVATSITVQALPAFAAAVARHARRAERKQRGRSSSLGSQAEESEMGGTAAGGHVTQLFMALLEHSPEFLSDEFLKLSLKQLEQCTLFDQQSFPTAAAAPPSAAFLRLLKALRYPDLPGQLQRPWLSDLLSRLMYRGGFGEKWRPRQEGEMGKPPAEPLLLGLQLLARVARRPIWASALLNQKRSRGLLLWLWEQVRGRLLVAPVSKEDWRLGETVFELLVLLAAARPGHQLSLLLEGYGHVRRFLYRLERLPGSPPGFNDSLQRLGHALDQLCSRPQHTEAMYAQSLKQAAQQAKERVRVSRLDEASAVLNRVELSAIPSDRTHEPLRALCFRTWEDADLALALVIQGALPKLAKAILATAALANSPSQDEQDASRKRSLQLLHESFLFTATCGWCPLADVQLQSKKLGLLPVPSLPLIALPSLMENF